MVLSSGRELSESPSRIDKYPWSLGQRVIMISTACFVSFLMSGVTVGHIGRAGGLWASLMMVAMREIILESKNYLCKDSAGIHNNDECLARELRLNGVFFISAIFVQVCL